MPNLQKELPGGIGQPLPETIGVENSLASASRGATITARENPRAEIPRRAPPDP